MGGAVKEEKSGTLDQPSIPGGYTREKRKKNGGGGEKRKRDINSGKGS